jgi:hypothetical protein
VTATDVMTDLDEMQAMLGQIRARAVPDPEAAAALDRTAGRFRSLADTAASHGEPDIAARTRVVARHCADAARAFRGVS